MANITNIKMVINNTFNILVLKDGENNSKLFSVPANGVWNGDIWVPWVSSQDDEKKAINIIDAAPSQILAFLFQDYWNPPGENAVKYCNTTFSYSGAIEVPGNNRGGGEKILIVNPAESGFSLFMK
ncbi:hypothetical protein [Burkholderia sp. TSV86]|uniref:hypothetical protein n=1 Tax=Burkholderia sp. TSV86 TaxID=1385594 RepID=UPI000A8C1EBF|nr:hypothetical protein [Burkholderia sp. TSV86]